jgi:hypothetical protein
MLIEGELGEMSLLGCSTPVFTHMLFKIPKYSSGQPG